MTLIELTVPSQRNRNLDTLPVAIIGAGPDRPGRSGEPRRTWHRLRGVRIGRRDRRQYPAVGPHAAVLAVEARRRPRIPAPSGGDRMGAPVSRVAADRHGARRAVPGAARRSSSRSPPGSALGVTVDAITRQGMDRTRTARRAATPFLLRTRSADGVQEFTARAVIDASGTYDHPNSLASSGLEPLGLPEVADRVSHALPDVLGRERDRFAGRHTTVVGAGHSAANTLLALAELADQEPGTRSRGSSGTPARCASPPRTTMASPLARISGAGWTRWFTPAGSRSSTGSRPSASAAPTTACASTALRGDDLVEHETDLVVNATGFRPNLDMLREIRLELDDIVEAPKRLAPLIDPNVHTLRHRRAARLRRAAAPRAELLPRRHEELRPRADLPPRHGIRAGPLDHRVDRGRSRRGESGGSRAAGHGRVLDEPAR